jgi:hypothetical protein
LEKEIFMLFSPPLLSPVFYLDPGSGSILIQLIVAAILGAGVIIRSQWARIKKWLGIKTKDTDLDPDDEEKSGQ